jgi:nitrate/nitrite transport system permease protein
VSIETIRAGRIEAAGTLATSPSVRRMSEALRGRLWFAGSLIVFLTLWQIAVQTGHASRLLPAPSTIASVAWSVLRHPFQASGGSDHSIGQHLLASLARVAVGFAIATVVAVPLGLAAGLNRVAAKALDPYVQLLRPVSPLAWLPIGLALFRSSDVAAIFVIAISSVWPIFLNTLFGVRTMDPTYLQVARTLGASRWSTLRNVVIPAAAPNIVEGLRVGIGIAWLVIVAAEMLSGGTGIGYYVWNAWNDLSLAKIITAIMLIGCVGLALDQLFALVERRVSYR